MGKIFCLMGKSASGKDYIYKQLLGQSDLNLKQVIPYTTRPIRIKEIDGESYFFCTDEEAEEMARAGKVIEMRSYDTACGVWKYFTADDGQIDLEHNDYLMIGTLESYEKIRDYFGDENVCPLYIWVEDGERLSRALRRERKQAEPKYAEMCRRFLADSRDFSEENLQKAGITHSFENLEKEQIVADVRAYIEQMRA
ncbi:MAG: guanylate kinase [Lachnospiraceae bacterium]|nr:guanylate kinase [Lachnospiraceae bacterium]